MVLDGEVVAASGRRIGIVADTVCVHGDNPAAVALAHRVRAVLAAASVSLAPMTHVLTARGR
jgi:UPF0271 protein